MKILRIFCGCAALALAALFVTPAAHAATTCTGSMTNLAFGAVDPTGTLVNTSATLSYSCTYNGGLLGGLTTDYVTACFSIGSGSQGSSLTPRVIKDANADSMSFQIYTDPARSIVWGSRFASGIAPPQVNLQIGGNGTQNGTLTVYGQVPAAQSGLGFGSYTSSFSGSSAELAFAYNEAFLNIGGGYPASCTNGATGGSTSNFAFTASANVQPLCKINTASDLNFGTVPGLINANVDQTSSISMTCINNTSWQVGLDNGQNASGTIRRMATGGNFVNYELYRDSNRSLRWGNTLNTDTSTGTGTGLLQTLTVYGRVAPQSAVPATGYTDKITVTVTY